LHEKSSRIFTAMDLPIFYIEEPASSDFMTLSEEASKHVVQVLRMQHGEKLQLTDGAGTLLQAEIVDAHKKKATVRVIEKKNSVQKDSKISIGISLLKNSSRFEWFLEKATEIGVTEIYPLLCQRTEKQHFRYDRMKQILVSAMIQSKQTWLPILHEPTAVSKVIIASSYTTKLIAHCEDETRNPITNFSKQPSVQILIGPEGDFTKEEIEAATSHNFIPVGLGENRLRTETAGVVAATFLCI
jgi:16S rRNA (uracil1498-N3)-methyltransferase